MDQTDRIVPNEDGGEPLLRVLPLGGLGEIGKNMLALQSGNNILIIDVSDSGHAWHRYCHSRRSICL
jgi:hypothetical protein